MIEVLFRFRGVTTRVGTVRYGVDAADVLGALARVLRRLADLVDPEEARAVGRAATPTSE